VSRYVSKPHRSTWDQSRRSGAPFADEYWHERAIQPLGHPMVFDREPAPIGILDHDGNPIYRMSDPLGFLPAHEAQDE